MKIKTYIDENGYRPNIYSKNKDIKKLGQWILNQINNYKKKIHIMKEEQIHDTFTQFLTEYNDYFIDNNTIWKKKLLKIKTCIDENGYRPNIYSEDKDIKKLGIWLSHQIQQYKKKTNIMNEKDIYNEFTQFLIEYDKYFKTKII